MISHLFDDHMFAMIIQPDRHFRGKAELPENSSKDNSQAFFSADTASHPTLGSFILI